MEHNTQPRDVPVAGVAGDLCVGAGGQPFAPARAGCGRQKSGKRVRRYGHPPDAKDDPNVHTVRPPEPDVTRRRLPALRAALSPRRRLAGALTGLTVLPLLTLGLAQRRGILNMPSQMLLYLLAVVVVALLGGLLPALTAAAAAAALLSYYFIDPPDFAIGDPNDVVALVAFLVVAGAVSSVVGLAARRAREAETLATANAASREELRVLAEEQAALRRVATLVARGVPAAEVFAAVTHEVGSVLGAVDALIVRLDPDGAATLAARTGAYADAMPVGSRWNLEPPLALAVALRTGRPARLDDASQASGAYGDAVRRLGMRSAVATPIIVEGHLWGAIAVGTRRERFPADTKQRMAGFTELVGTAIANAEGRAQLEDSRDELRRIAQEQAALRRVATLVARGLPPAEVFAAVADEVSSVLGADGTVIVRRDPDGATTLVASVGAHRAELPVGSRWKPEPPVAVAVALRTGRPARCDDYSQAPGEYADAVRRIGFRSSVAAPIVVEGRLWGGIAIGTRHGRFPADTEERMAGFTELIGTAIANAEGRAQLEDSRDELRQLAQEQAALRRVATLVAHGLPPAEVLTAVAHEVRHVLGADATNIVRLDPDGVVTVLTRVGDDLAELPVGSRWRPEPPVAVAVALRTGRPARCDDYSQASGAFADAVRRMGLRSAVAAPIVVEGRLWGAIAIGDRRERLPADTEQRMAGFTELVGTAIANADSHDQLTASRARIVAAADHARRRIERDLHDGTQQRLVSLGLALRLAQATVPAELPELQTQIGRVADELDGCDRRAARARPRHPPGDPVRRRAEPGPAHPRPPRRDPGRTRHPHRNPRRGPDRGGGLLRRVRGTHQHHQTRPRLTRARHRRTTRRPAAPLDPRRRHRRRRSRRRFGPDRAARPSAGPGRDDRGQQPSRGGDRDRRRASPAARLTGRPPAMRRGYAVKPGHRDGVVGEALVEPGEQHDDYAESVLVLLFGQARRAARPVAVTAAPAAWVISAVVNDLSGRSFLLTAAAGPPDHRGGALERAAPAGLATDCRPATRLSRTQPRPHAGRPRRRRRPGRPHPPRGRTPIGRRRPPDGPRTTHRPPDLPRTYDDGGLVDLNSAPADAIANTCGIEIAVGTLIVNARAAEITFTTIDDVFSITDLPYPLWDRIRDRAVVITG